MYYLNFHNALWNCFGFHIAQIGYMLLDTGTISSGIGTGPGCHVADERLGI